MSVAEAFQLALDHHGAGRLAEAEALYREILGVQPQHADALHNLGLLAHQVGWNDVAIEMIERAVALRPDVPCWQSNLGEVRRALGNMDAAIAACRRAIALQPNLADAWSNLGCALWGAGRLAESEEASRRAIAIVPGHAEAHTNLGNVLGELGRFDEAVAEFHRAIESSPEHPDAWGNLGGVLCSTGKFSEAIEACSRAIRLRPQMAEAHNNLGLALAAMGRQDEALAVIDRAIKLRPGFATAHDNRGNVLKEQGRIPEALASYGRALELNPAFAEARSNLLVTQHYSADCDARSLFAAHCLWDELHAQRLARFIVPHRNAPEPARRLRVGYVSPDFRNHPVAAFFENLLGSHDAREVEVFCYSCTACEDAVTARLRQQAAHWRRITGMDDAQAAELVREDGVDILVDLAGHTAHGRLGVFARKPAPVQVTYLGYADTTGLRAMDWRLTDAHADPPGMTEHLHSEKLFRLPDSAWCFRPADAVPTVSALPALAAGCVTFGTLNKMPRISDAFVALCAKVLLAVPGSRLLLRTFALANASVRQRVGVLLEKEGIAAERIELDGRMLPAAEHLTSYDRVDVALDTFPCNGTTTTCEALWMGVPVVTFAGLTHAGRVGVSLLKNVGLPELIAGSEAETISIAAKLAADIPRLTEFRATLRERMRRSVLTDGAGFARNVEAAYREMWRVWCAKQA